MVVAKHIYVYQVCLRLLILPIPIAFNCLSEKVAASVLIEGKMRRKKRLIWVSGFYFVELVTRIRRIAS